MATTGPAGPGGANPFEPERFRRLLRQKNKSQTGDANSARPSDASALSDAAKKMAITKDEKMLQTMKAELAQLDPGSETFMEEATEKLIDSVIDQEYGEGFKEKKGYENLQEKLVATILSNEETRDAVGDFFELLLEVEALNEEEEFDDEEAEGESEEDDEFEESFEDEESYEEE